MTSPELQLSHGGRRGGVPARLGLRHLAGALSLLACLAGTACSDAGPPFDPTQMTWARGSGTASLTGRAIVMGHHLTVLSTCAGQPVALLPVTPYTQGLEGERDTSSLGSILADQRLAPFTRHAICDSEGHFTFTDLPSGQWLVTTVVSPLATDPANPLQHTQKRLTLAVETQAGQTSAAELHYRQRRSGPDGSHVQAGQIPVLKNPD
jgi:hypothetical protein